MTLPVTGLLSELVFNHRRAMTSEVWRWAFEQVLGGGVVDGKCHQGIPGADVPRACVLQGPAASR